MGTHIDIENHTKMESEDQETLFHSYPCCYYVQSPSTISHANSADLNKTHINTEPEPEPEPEVSTFTLSRYSSSRGSNNSNFLNKKVVDGDESGIKRLIIVDGLEEEDEDDYYYGRKGGFWWIYCSFRRNSSLAWISLQLSWRLLFSLCVAVLVFYIATKPPPPTISIKMGGVREFGLGEGVDGSGVTTKILTTNCSLHLLVDNNSRLFALHIHPPILQMFFAHLPFAISRGSKLYAESHSSRVFKLYVGTKNKAMYGAGRMMEDVLESGNGLPILIRLRFTCHFQVLIHPKHHYQAQCLLFLHKNNHSTQPYNTTCTLS
ncbi:uncharacterized protein [Euphorbia lathyris]|uniref:uncharacterized protein n=1 Tax=Euphorbia lathyris TaxID=212925 RepID=UPI0033138D5C